MAHWPKWMYDLADFTTLMSLKTCCQKITLYSSIIPPRVQLLLSNGHRAESPFSIATAVAGKLLTKALWQKGRKAKATTLDINNWSNTLLTSASFMSRDNHKLGQNDKGNKMQKTARWTHEGCHIRRLLTNFRKIIYAASYQAGIMKKNHWIASMCVINAILKHPKFRGGDVCSTPREKRSKDRETVLGWVVH